MKKTPRNLLALIPERSVEWELRDDGLVVLLVPKFRHPLLVRWVVPRLRTPVLRVKLDSVGSFIWEHCDGRRTVQSIAGKFREKFGDKIDPRHDRLALFFQMLEREHYVSMSQ
ncbi:MAG: PqqD family protein [Bacteroidetes bacterium]|nr:PqqD family protein [Bacteroidota bacterium]